MEGKISSVTETLAVRQEGLTHIQPATRSLRRTKSIGNIWEMKTKLGKLENFLADLPDKIKGNVVVNKLMERRKSFIAERMKKKMAENKMEGSGTYPTSPVDPKILAILLLPLLPVILYAMIFFFSSIFLFIYMQFLVLYFSVLIAYFIAEVAIRPPWYKPTKPEEGLTMDQLPPYWQGIYRNPKYDLNLDYEDVEFEATDGLMLRGWFVPAPKKVASRRIGICLVHGGGRDRRAWLRHVPLFHEQGYDCLLFDFSEHGCSDGTRRGFSYGIREKHDVRSAVRWMKEAKGLARIVAVGTSVGGSSVIMAAAEDANIDAVIAENPVACAEDFALFHLNVLLATYMPSAARVFLVPFYALVTRVFLYRIGALFGYDRPKDVIHKLSPRPVLLMHGTSDDLVPCDHSKLLYARAKEPKALWLAKDAWHCALYDKDPEEYHRRVHSFLNKHFPADVAAQKPGREMKVVDASAGVASAERRKKEGDLIVAGRKGKEKKDEDEEEAQDEQKDRFR